MKTEIIKCPNCDAEYLPAEIFLPKEFIGKPYFIEKNYAGKLLDFCGENMNLHETYICDKCNKRFNIKATVYFTTFSDSKTFIEDEHVTHITKKQLFMLNED